MYVKHLASQKLSPLKFLTPLVHPCYLLGEFFADLPGQAKGYEVGDEAPSG